MSGQSTASKLAAARRRIAELEAEVERLEAQLATRRDVSSTTGGSTTIRSTRWAPVGFTKDVTA